MESSGTDIARKRNVSPLTTTGSARQRRGRLSWNAGPFWFGASCRGSGSGHSSITWPRVIGLPGSSENQTGSVVIEVEGEAAALRLFPS